MQGQEQQEPLHHDRAEPRPRIGVVSLPYTWGFIYYHYVQYILAVA